MLTKSDRWRNVLEIFIQVLIFYSIGTHFVEIEIHKTERSAGFFLWSERVVASIFTMEYLARWAISRSWLYPFRPIAIIDAISIVPFYVGFFVDLRSLRLIRTLRVLRLFKLYRYSAGLQNLVNAFIRIRYEFGVLAFALLVVGWFSSVAVFELEREAQPEAFSGLFDSGWFVLVTLTTVGYGDKVPITTGGKIISACTMVAGMGVFGTFISLIGGAFLEEIRDAMQRQAAATRELPAMSVTDFDPQLVLQTIDAGRFRRPDGSASPEALQLLMTSCLVLLLNQPAENANASRGMEPESTI